MRRSKSWFYVVSLSICMVTLGLASCGGGGSEDSPTPTPTPGGISLFAGSLQSAGAADGQGTAAQFTGPEGVAVDKAGNLYVTDTAAHTVRKVTPDGLVTTLAGIAGQAGSDNGPGSAARFAFPRGIAVDAAGSVYVADSGNHVIRKITPAGLVTTWVGAAGQSGNMDGAANTARLKQPTRLTLDSAGVLYVTDQNQTVRKVNAAGVVSTFVTVVDVNLSFGSSGPTGLTGIAVDAAGYVYVAELTGAIRKFAPNGTPAAWGVGATDGKVTIPGATDLAIDATGSIMVAVGGSYSIGPCASYGASSVEKIAMNGSVQHVSGMSGVYGCGGTTIFGNVDGDSATARFGSPTGLAIDLQGNLWIADTTNYAIRKISPLAIVSTVAGGRSSGNVDGQGEAARFSIPRGIAVDGGGSLLIADVANQAVRQVDSSGAVSTLKVIGEPGSDPSSHIAGLQGPIAVDKTGSIFVWQRLATVVFSIGKIDTSHRYYSLNSAAYITTMAANPSLNGLYTADQNGAIHQMGADGTSKTLATGFGSMNALAVNHQGTVFAADTNHTISSIDNNGKVTLLAGQSGQAGYQDGAGITARFEYPSALALDDSGNLYVADRSCTIRKITPNAAVSTIAGNAGQCSTILGNLPGALGAISDLTWMKGALYALTGDAVVKISLPTP